MPLISYFKLSPSCISCADVCSVCCDVAGLKTGEVNKPQTFTIETRGAGQGGVGLSVVGPTEPKIGCVDNHDGTLTVEYLPNSVGNYEIAVSFADQPVPGLHTSLHCSVKCCTACMLAHSKAPDAVMSPSH